VISPESREERGRTIHTPRYVTAVAVVSALAAAGAANADVLHTPGSSPYLTFADSPFASAAPSMDYFHLETFEDGLLNTPGLTASAGLVRSPSGYTDSVDGDGNGVIDGFGGNGFDFFAQDPNGASITFTFDESTLGRLPTAAGLVWTDGNAAANVTFEVFGDGGVLLDSFVTMLGDGNHMASTDADRFLGVEMAEGISAIRISADLGSLEIDHVQYGAFAVIPGPGVLVALAFGVGMSGRRRRRNLTA